MTIDAKITAIAPWFGGKRSMAPMIATELGPHAQYFEPFCGSMAVLFGKEPSRQETVNDLHGDLINLARVLQDSEAAPALYERTQRVLVCEDLLAAAEREIAKPFTLPDTLTRSAEERAYWYFLSCWLARNGVAGMERIDYQLAVRWTAGGGSPATRWRSATESIPAWHQRLKNVVILQRDAFEMLAKIDDAPTTAIYCDPPYAEQSRSHGKYKHDFEHGGHLFGDDHKRLRDLLSNFKQARVVVSYYDCNLIRQIYRGWTFIDHARQKNLHAQNGRGARKCEAPEVLIVNGPSFAKESAA